MASFAKAEFALNARQEDGETLRTHLRSAWRQTGVKPQQWPDATLPAHGKYLWDYWRDLHSRRGSNGFGPNRLSWQDLEAWSRRRRVMLDPWEVDAILGIDDAYIDSAAPPKESQQ